MRCEESKQNIKLIRVIKMNSKVYKWCAVPQCKNTSIRIPNKVFVHVPNHKIIRDKWLKLARRNPNDVVTNSPLYFCEDHFNLPNDMKNYMEYHVIGSVSQVRMKPGCMPHKFICQPDRKTRTSDTTEQSYIAKKRRMILEDSKKEFEEKSVAEQSSFDAIASGSSAPIFRKCELKDQICLKAAVQDALPKLKGGLSDWGVPSLDPLLIPEMSIGAGKNVVQLTQNYKNAYLSGPSDTKITDFKFDLTQMRINIGFTFPEWVFNATYEVRGRILLLPVLGKGLCSLILENGQGTQTFKIEKYKKKGKTYLRSIDGKLDISPKKVTYQFDNLFDGNKLLGDNINKVLNDNWKDVYDEVKHGYAEVYSATFMNIMNRILSRLPVFEIFSDAF